MGILDELGTCFVRKYVFDTHDGVRCRNYHHWTYQRWKIPRRNHPMENWLFHVLASKEWENSFLCHFDDNKYFMHDVGTPDGALWVNKWLMHSKTRYSPVVDFGDRCVFYCLQKNAQVFLGSDYMDVEYW